MKKTNKQSITLDIPITYLAATWKGSFDKLPANKTYELIIDYPLSNPARYQIKTGKTGMGLVKLLGTIGKLYQKTYDVEDSSMDNEEDGGRYGIWGHDIGDLALEGIDINHKTKKITLDIGS